MARRPGVAPFAAVQAAGVSGSPSTDASVRKAMKIAFERMKLVLEPSGAASLAALIDGGVDVAGKTVLVIATGGNVSLADFMKHIEPCLKQTSSSSAPARPARPLAYRLSEDGRHQRHRDRVWRHRFRPADPDAGGAVVPDEHERSTTGALRTEPEPHLGGRVLATPRGKVIGGSSSINGMVYVRGHARDFDHWAEAGRGRLGASPTCCPTSSAWRTPTAARMAGAAATARCMCSAGKRLNPLYRRLRRGRPPGRLRD